MWHFIVRRTFYSLLILLGVVLLTFLLFNVAAGDPAAAVLGKNARPDEVESLRRELGADLPLFWGRACRTEAFPEYRSGAPLTPGVIRADGEIRLERRFETADLNLRIQRADGTVTERTIAAADGTVRLPADTRRAEFFRMQAHPWNSQFLRALGEIVH